MNLKEGFRYQNFLNALMLDAHGYLFIDEHLFKTTKVHKRKKSNPEAEDSTETVEVDNPFDVNKVIDFMAAIITEKEELTAAINKAKASAEYDVDALIEGNKLRNEFCDQLKSIMKKKGKTTTHNERGFMLNNEKNQVPYYYEVEETKEELFDRKTVSELFEKSSKKSADISNQIDVLRVMTPVDFEPRFNVNLTFEDEFERFAKTDSESA
jgi:hypothetical protein